VNALYNEIEPFAVKWLGNLSAEGHIAEGKIDARSIRELGPDVVRGFAQVHFFAGIGIWSHALRLAGWPDSRPVWTGSCPCQPFSTAGKRAGTADERHLWPEWFRLIRECRPAVVFGEQVASPDGLAWLDAVCADLEGAGYAVGAADLCAEGGGAPHLRQRLYFVAIATGQRFDGLRISGVARQESAQADRRGENELAVADSGRQSEPIIERNPAGCGAIGMADATTPGEWRRRILGPGEGAGEDGVWTPDQSSGRGETGELADTSCVHPFGGRERSGVDEPRRSGAGTLPGEGKILAGTIPGVTLGDSEREGLERLSRDGDNGNQPGRDRTLSDRHASEAGRTNFWEPCEWIPCADGKSRPIEPGSPPLVTVDSGGLGRVQPGVVRLASRNRVGRLKGYGNSIVAELAATFIRAAMESS